MAFYIQNLKIKEDKSIGNPEFFKNIPDEYKQTVIYIKDSEPRILSAYLQRRLSVTEIQRYNKEIKQSNER